MPTIMKTSEKTDQGLKGKEEFRKSFSFFENDFRVKQIYNRSFVVPWQMVEFEKKEFVLQ
jgi:hypothetical protein